jgi:hypothetical protein
MANLTFKNTRDRWMAKGVGERIETIDNSALEPAETPVSSSTGYELICSYNWVNRKEPTIYVPGNWLPLDIEALQYNLTSSRRCPSLERYQPTNKPPERFRNMLHRPERLTDPQVPFRGSLPSC